MRISLPKVPQDDLPVITGHYGTTTGRKVWKSFATFINFGSRFLSPQDGCRTGTAHRKRRRRR